MAECFHCGAPLQAQAQECPFCGHAVDPKEIPVCSSRPTAGTLFTGRVAILTETAPPEPIPRKNEDGGAAVILPEADRLTPPAETAASGTVGTGGTAEAPVTAETGETEEAPVAVETGEPEEAPVAAGTGETEGTPVTVETGETEETPVTAETGETEEAPVAAETGETEEASDMAKTGDTEETPAMAETGETEDASGTAETGDTETKQEKEPGVPTGELKFSPVQGSPDECEVTGFTGMLPENITIPSVMYGRKVTGIARNALAHSNIRILRLPSSMIRVGDCAFTGCRSLEKVLGGRRITTLGAGVFNGCFRISQCDFLFNPEIRLPLDRDANLNRVRNTLIHEKG